jgi:hypothetical protein
MGAQKASFILLLNLPTTSLDGFSVAIQPRSPIMRFMTSKIVVLPHPCLPTRQSTMPILISGYCVEWATRLRTNSY